MISSSSLQFILRLVAWFLILATRDSVDPIKKLMRLHKGRFLALLVWEERRWRVAICGSGRGEKVGECWEYRYVYWQW